MRVILDSNVLIAAVAGRGLCESLLELCIEEHDLIISEELLEEVRRNLVAKIRLTDAVALDFCRLLRNHSIMATPATVAPDACRDPKDIHLLGLSESAQAEFLVSGDRDLAESGWRGGTRILTPRQFWEKCRQRR
jgi:putative PIN family toxin of toxin-antitoxin system